MADCISALPDTILCHILSFLPTKHAVATHILSKRWMHLWRSVPALDFSDKNVTNRETCFSFNKFVDSVLLSRDAAQPIQRFRLVSESYLRDISNITKWINIVLQRRVEDLHLDMITQFILMPKLPISIFSCRTLVVLKLNGFTVTGFSSVRLHSLKILHLQNIVFPKDRYLMELLAGCPILESFQAYLIRIDSIECLTCGGFKSLGLTKLTRATIVSSYIHFPLAALYNAEFLFVEIEKVYCNSDNIPVFNNLTHMELIFLDYDWDLLVKVLNHCPKLQSLVLNESDMEDVVDQKQDDQDNWTDPEFVPECLSLHLRVFTLRNYGGLQGELLFARYVMKNARALQTMTIWSTQYSNQEEKLAMIKELFLGLISSPQCRISFH